MSQKIKKGLFRIMPWSLAMVLIFAFAISTWQVMPVRVAKAVAPTGFLLQVYRDNNDDGTIDIVSVEINGGEDLENCNVTSEELATDWTYTGGDIGGSITSASCFLVDKTINFVISGANPGVTGHTVAPTIAYDNDDGDASITNASGTLGTVGVVSLNDFANPAIISAITDDNDNDGQVDRLALTFSEQVDINDSMDPGFDGFGLSGSYGIAGSDYSDSNTTTMTLIITESGSPDTGVTINPTYSTEYSNTIIDNVSIEMINGETVTGTDGAAPVLVSASYLDTGGNGTIETLRTTWSENVTVDDSDAVDWTVVLGGANVIFSATVDDAVAGPTLDVTVTADANETISAGTTIAYDNDDANGSVTDGTNVAGTNAAVTASDAAAPVMLMAGFLDAGTADGTVDTFSTLWSEDFTMSGSTLDDWTIGGGSISAVFSSAANGSSVERIKNITVSADANETGSATDPTIIYDNDDANNSIVDSSGNPAGTSGSIDVDDNAAPYLISATYSDSQTSGTGYGEVDRIILIFTENTSFTYQAEDWDFTTAGDVTLSGDFYEACTGSGTPTIVCTDSDNGLMISAENKTGKQTSLGNEPVWRYQNFVSLDSVSDGSNAMGTISKTLIDGAKPMLASSSPTSGATGVSRTGNIELTFSEVMEDTGDYAVNSTNVTCSPSWGSPTVSSDANDVVWTFDPSNTLTAGTSHTVIVSTSVKDNSAAANVMGSSTITFSTVSSGSTGGGGGASVASTTPTITLGTVGALTSGDTKNLTWSVGGSGIDTVALYYSIDSGATYNQIAYNLDRTLGTYAWTVPALETSTALVKIIAYDSGKAQLDTDVSSSFSITLADDDEEVVTPAEVVSEDITEVDSEGRVVALDSDETGTSPLTGETEAISTVATGQYIRGYGYPTVYYIDESLNRRPFWDVTTFFTYADSWDEVVWVTDATLSTMTIGQPMLPAPGVVLIKIQSDPKVYAIDDINTLRWVPDEITATTLYGTTWSDYIIDVEPTIFSRFEVGDDMTTADTVDTSIMKTRVELAVLAQ